MSGLEQPFVMGPVGNHQGGVENENDAHDEQVAGHHEHPPHEHADRVREGHENPELLAAGKEHHHPRDQLGGADEGEQKLCFEHCEHKGGGFRLGVTRGHDRGVAPVDVVEVFDA